MPDGAGYTLIVYYMMIEGERRDSGGTVVYSGGPLYSIYVRHGPARPFRDGSRVCKALAGDIQLQIYTRLSLSARVTVLERGWVRVRRSINSQFWPAALSFPLHHLLRATSCS